VRPPIDRLSHEGFVRGERRKIRVPAHQQRLRDDGLESTMRLLGDAVSWARPGVTRLERIP
jgi:hypothetical protein